MAIELKNVTMKYDEKVVIDNLTCSFGNNSFTCIMGESGIGKTTLSNIILGLTNSYSGQIVMPKNTRFAAVFQEDRLIDTCNAFQNVNLVHNKSTLTQDSVKDDFAAVLLDAYDTKPVAEYSGGMKRRVALLRALLSDYEVLILDEPFNGLDEKSRLAAANYIKRKAFGKIVIMITHNKEDVAFFDADTIVL